MKRATIPSLIAGVAFAGLALLSVPQLVAVGLLVRAITEALGIFGCFL